MNRNTKPTSDSLQFVLKNALFYVLFWQDLFICSSWVYNIVLIWTCEFFSSCDSYCVLILQQPFRFLYYNYVTTRLQIVMVYKLIVSFFDRAILNTIYS